MPVLIYDRYHKTVIPLIFACYTYIYLFSWLKLMLINFNGASLKYAVHSRIQCFNVDDNTGRLFAERLSSICVLIYNTAGAHLRMLFLKGIFKFIW